MRRRSSVTSSFSDTVNSRNLLQISWNFTGKQATDCDCNYCKFIVRVSSCNKLNVCFSALIFASCCSIWLFVLTAHFHTTFTLRCIKLHFFRICLFDSFRCVISCKKHTIRNITGIEEDMEVQQTIFFPKTPNFLWKTSIFNANLDW